MCIIGIILLSIVAVGILSIFIYTYWTRNYGKSEEQEKEYICPICGKLIQQGETDWEDNIEVWVNCSHCGFQSSSRYYYDQYCGENNEDKKNTIVKQIKVKSLKNYLK
jgi:DNA-directed RNA polymerase subunit RPC12/RpoP